MRTFLLLGIAVLLLGCRDSEDRVAPGRRGEEQVVAPEQFQALHAGNERLAAKIAQYMSEVKRMPVSLDELKTWAGARWDAGDESALTDPWGNKVIMFVQLSSAGTATTLRSKGPDGKTSSDDLTYDSRDKATRTFVERNPN